MTDVLDVWTRLRGSAGEGFGSLLCLDAPVAAPRVAEAAPLAERIAAVELVEPTAPVGAVGTAPVAQSVPAAEPTLDRVGLGALTDDEAVVLRALAEGRTVGQIADSWHVSEPIVRTQVRGMLTKLGVTTQVEAVATARLAGWHS